MAPQIDFVHPTEPPQGNKRLLERLRALLRDAQIRRVRIAVAFAKLGPLLRLQDEVRAFRARHGRVQAVIGIDACGTSKQALEFALVEFDSVGIWHHPNLGVTFHPKVYLAEGDTGGVCIVGSQNLTGGGMETNAEASVQLSYNLPAEVVAWSVAERSWSDILASPNYAALTPGLLSALDLRGLLLDEAATQARRGSAVGKALGGVGSLFPWSPVAPPSPRPSSIRAGQRTRVAPRAVPSPVSPSTVTATHPALPRALLIQVVARHNGEVVLSTNAVNEHPAFFGLPFTGTTAPKKAKNPPFPQRVPAPVTDWMVFDRSGAVVDRLQNWALTMVDYTSAKRSELRVTVQHAFAAKLPIGGLLVMTAVTGGGLDYVCEVFDPASPQFAALISACTKTMPSGGSRLQRRYGWV